MVEQLSFNPTPARLEKIKDFVSKGLYPNMGACVNSALDLLFKTHETKKSLDFMYWIALPFFFFLILVGICLLFPSFFFYILLSISGIYLIIFTYLFFDKYKGIRGK